MTPQPLTDAEFDSLSGVLSRYGGKDAMNLEQLDGFLAAVICFPRRIPEIEYLPAIWGDETINEKAFVAQPALQKFRPVEVLPGDKVRDDDDESLAKAAGDIGTTIFHPVGTAKMGLPSDPSAVTDARLRVLGIERLRVIDASVMPTITSGNTNSPTMMIAEKGAQMVLADQRR